jgi:hypothetical protein
MFRRIVITSLVAPALGLLLPDGDRYEGEMRADRPIDPPCACRQARRSGPVVDAQRVFEENFRVYGVRKVWRQLKREGYRYGQVVSTPRSRCAAGPGTTKVEAPSWWQ